MCADGYDSFAHQHEAHAPPRQLRIVLKNVSHIAVLFYNSKTSS